ncbi:hypothetical protein ACLB2K_037253 [Fragaria x ananassa]
MEGAGEEGIDRMEDSKDLQQQSKAFDKLTDRVEDRQLDSTRVQEAMASIAATSEADLEAMRKREKELATVKINPRDVEIIANELELDKLVAERTLREHKAPFSHKITGHKKLFPAPSLVAYLGASPNPILGNCLLKSKRLSLEKNMPWSLTLNSQTPISNIQQAPRKGGAGGWRRLRDRKIVAADLDFDENYKRVVEEVVKAYNCIDILVNNAAEQYKTGSVQDIDEARIERVFRTYIFASFFMARNALKHLKELKEEAT